MSEATSVKSNIVCLPRSRESETHRLGSEGEPLAVVLDDVVGGGVVGDDLDLTVDGFAIDGDALDSDDNNGSHDRLLPLPRGDCRLPWFEAKATRNSLITRDEVSTAKETYNTSLHQPRSHLVLTSACQ